MTLLKDAEDPEDQTEMQLGVRTLAASPTTQNGLEAGADGAGKPQTRARMKAKRRGRCSGRSWDQSWGDRGDHVDTQPGSPPGVGGEGAARLLARPLPRLVDLHPRHSGFSAEHSHGRFLLLRGMEPQLNQMLR